MATKYTIIICLTASMGMCAFSFAAVAWSCPAANSCLAPIRQAEQKDRAEASISREEAEQRAYWEFFNAFGIDLDRQIPEYEIVEFEGKKFGARDIPLTDRTFNLLRSIFGPDLQEDGKCQLLFCNNLPMALSYELKDRILAVPAIPPDAYDSFYKMKADILRLAPDGQDYIHLLGSLIQWEEIPGLSREIAVFQGVFPIGRQIKVMCAHLQKTVKLGDWLLDHGAGCGVYGLVAAQNGANVVALDINPLACANARFNAWLLGLPNLDVRESCGLNALRPEEKNKFNVVAYFPPIPTIPTQRELDKKPFSFREMAIYDDAGRTNEDFFGNIGDYLAAEGRIYVLESFSCDMLEIFARDNNLCIKGEITIPEQDGTICGIISEMVSGNQAGRSSTGPDDSAGTSIRVPGLGANLEYIPGEVLSPRSASTEMFIRLITQHPELFRGKRILEIGTGAGPLAIAMLQAGAAEVVATDIVRSAVEIAERNVRAVIQDEEIRNRAKFGVGDVYEALTNVKNRYEGFDAKGRFDIIISNHPIAALVPIGEDTSTFIAAAGRNFRMIQKLIEGLPNMLKPAGTALLWSYQGEIRDSSIWTEEKLDEQVRRLTERKALIPEQWYVQQAGETMWLEFKEGAEAQMASVFSVSRASLDESPGHKRPIAIGLAVDIPEEADLSLEEQIRRKGVGPGREIKRILVVDDELTPLEVQAVILERLKGTVLPHDAEIVQMHSGGSALQLIQEKGEVFDLIITDQRMPYVSGTALMLEVRKMHPDISMALTFGDSNDVRLTAQQLKALDGIFYLQKPREIQLASLKLLFDALQNPEIIVRKAQPRQGRVAEVSP